MRPAKRACSLGCKIRSEHLDIIEGGCHRQSAIRNSLRHSVQQNQVMGEDGVHSDCNVWENGTWKGIENFPSRTSFSDRCEFRCVRGVCFARQARLGVLPHSDGLLYLDVTSRSEGCWIKLVRNDENGKKLLFGSFSHSTGNPIRIVCTDH
jgi:hypothetical protein